MRFVGPLLSDVRPEDYIAVHLCKHDILAHIFNYIVLVSIFFQFQLLE